MAVSNPDAGFIHRTPCKHKIRSPLSPWIAFLSINRRYSTFSSLSGCQFSSSVLENASNELKISEIHQNLPVLHALESNSENLNNFLCNLFKDRRNESLAFEFYRKAKDQPNFRPEPLILKLLIGYMVSSKQWKLISELAEDFECFDVFPDAFTCSKLIRNCITARKFKTAENLLNIFEKSGEIAVQAFYWTMKSYNKLHMYSTTISVYERMKSAGISPDSDCYCCIIEAYRKTGQTDKVLEVFIDFKANCLKIDQKPYLVHVYFNLFESLGKSGKASQALQFFREMIEQGIKPEISFYTSLICSLASFKTMKEAEDLFDEALNKGMVKDPVVFLKLVLMYVEEGLLEKTLEMVKVMNEMKIRVTDCVFCAVVNGYAKKRGLTATVSVYQELVSAGCTPGQVTYSSIINVYCRLGLFSKAELAFAEMQEQGYSKCVVAYASIVSMYGKVGRLRDAMRLVATMKQRGCNPNVWVYNSLMDMHGRAMNLRQVEKIWKEMKRRKVEPDRVSYTTIIYAYNKAREFEECMGFYQEFRINGGKIDKVLGGIMVGVYSKSSRIDELVRLLRDMKSECISLDARLHRSAMNALRDAGLQVHLKWFIESFGSEE